IKAGYRAALAASLEAFYAEHPEARSAPVNDESGEAEMAVWNAVGDFMDRDPGAVRVTDTLLGALGALAGMKYPDLFLGKGWFEIHVNTGKEPQWWTDFGNDAYYQDLVAEIKVRWRREGWKECYEREPAEAAAAPPA